MKNSKIAQNDTAPVDAPEGPQVQLKYTDKDGVTTELFETTTLKYASENPKREGTKIHKLWTKYSGSTTVAELQKNFGKGWKAAIKFDADRGHLTIISE